jgi:predicted dehydrogenase
MVLHQGALRGILVDIGSHQFDQFLLHRLNAGEIVAAQVGISLSEHAELEDFGDVVQRGDGGNGYFRVDWYTPDGLETWGDGRLTVLGTDGYIEVRKYTDIGGRTGGDHLFLVDKTGVHYINCQGGDLPYGRQLIADVLERTETAMSQAYCFLASELSLKAEAAAARLGYLAT